MSYDLDFWRYKAGVTLDDQDVYERLSDGQFVEGLEELPIDKMRARIAEIFNVGWTKLDFNTWDSGKKSFQVFTTRQFFRVDCYGLTGDEMNSIIDLAHEFRCPLYDPQEGKRYTIG